MDSCKKGLNVTNHKVWPVGDMNASSLIAIEFTDAFPNVLPYCWVLEFIYTSNNLVKVNSERGVDNHSSAFGVED